MDDLRRGVEVLIWRAGVAHGREMVVAMADEVLQEVVVRALARAAAFDASRSAHAWLYGFAVNIVRERRREALADSRRRVPLSDLELDHEDVAALGMELLTAASPADGLAELLDLAAPMDREVLRLAFAERLRGPELAKCLGTTEGAARVRLSRALRRFRELYRAAERAAAEERG